jgi:hypothetical protein
MGLPRLLLDANGDPEYICIPISEVLSMIKISADNEARGNEMLTHLDSTTDQFATVDRMRCKAQGMKEMAGEVFFYGFGKYPK